MSREREKVHFASGGTRCAAWHYPGSNGGCVIMAGGFAVTKEPGTDPFAKRFHEAGFAVLAFDYRGLGESDGQPRQVAPIGGQLADWQAAIEFARTLPGVDPARLAGERGTVALLATPAERAANEPAPNEPAPNSEHPAAGVPTTPALAAPAAAAAGSASTDLRG
jgi:uncharacterized protein